jgi:hypothetical protein
LQNRKTLLHGFISMFSMQDYYFCNGTGLFKLKNAIKINCVSTSLHNERKTNNPKTILWNNKSLIA